MIKENIGQRQIIQQQCETWTKYTKEVKKKSEGFLRSKHNLFGVDYLIESLIRFPVMQSFIAMKFSLGCGGVWYWLRVNLNMSSSSVK